MNEEQYQTLINKVDTMQEKIDKLFQEFTFHKGIVKGVALVGFVLWGFAAYVGTNYQQVKDDNDQKLFGMVYAHENRLTKLEVHKDEDSKN